MNLPPGVNASMTRDEIVQACLDNGMDRDEAAGVALIVKGYDPTTDFRAYLAKKATARAR